VAPLTEPLGPGPKRIGPRIRFYFNDRQGPENRARPKIQSKKKHPAAKKTRRFEIGPRRGRKTPIGGDWEMPGPCIQWLKKDCATRRNLHAQVHPCKLHFTNL